MAILQKQEAEIPLNGGMDVKQNAELQSSSTLRLVEDLRWNKLGELERRPAQASSATQAAPSGSVYTSTTMDGVLSRGQEVLGITRDHGLVSLSSDGASLGFMRRVTDEADTIDAALKYSPMSCNVSRRFVARANGRETEITAVTSAIYNGKQFVAWTTTDSGGSGQTLHVRVVDADTGALVMQEQTAVLGASLVVYLNAIPYTESGQEGVLMTVAYEAGAVYRIEASIWYESTNDFGHWAQLTSNAATPKHALKADGATFLFAFTDATSGVMQAYSGCTVAVGLGTLHTATHGALGGCAFVVGSTRTLIVSVNGATYDVGTALYAEVFGTPASVLTLRALGGAGSDYLTGCSVALETRNGVTNAAVVFASGVEETGIPDAEFTAVHFVDFTNTAPTEISESIVNQTACVGAATVGGRAYGVFALSKYLQSSALQITSLVVARATCSLTGASDPVRCDPVARLCHERFYVREYNINDHCVIASGDSLYVSMTADPVNNNRPQTLFVGRVAFEGKPASFVDLGDGTVLFGNGMLHAYDGDTPSEAQPIARPYVILDDDGAGAITGTVGAIAMWSWVDAAGNLHRSEPSVAVDITLSAEALDVYVSAPPFTAYDGVTAPEITCELYLTEVDGADYYRAATVSLLNRKYDSMTTKNQWFKFENVTVGNPAMPLIYTTQAGGEERASKAPPAFRAITRVGDLLWAIDAEDPSRIWPSKPLVAGYAPEWNTLNTLFIGDRGVGISDVNGVPTIFAEHGIWQVYGEGPNSLGVGSFAPARRLPHEVECLDGLSVCKTGAGVFFRGRRGVYLLDTGLALQPVGLSVDANLSVSGTPDGYCRIVYDELSNEVHVIDFGELQPHYVFNLLESKWSQWSQVVARQWWKDACVIRGRMHVLCDGSSADTLRRIYAIDEAGYKSDTTYGWAIETPWYRFDGATGNMRIWRIIAQLRLGSSDNGECGGRVTINYNTRDGDNNQFIWTSEALNDLLTTAQGDDTVNLRCDITDQRARQFKLEITCDAANYAYEGHVPIALRIDYGITPKGKDSAGQRRGNSPLS